MWWRDRGRTLRKRPSGEPRRPPLCRQRLVHRPRFLRNRSSRGHQLFGKHRRVPRAKQDVDNAQALQGRVTLTNPETGAMVINQFAGRYTELFVVSGDPEGIHTREFNQIGLASSCGLRTDEFSPWTLATSPFERPGTATSSYPLSTWSTRDPTPTPTAISRSSARLSRPPLRSRGSTASG
jgi:hypothetical protein